MAAIIEPVQCGGGAEPYGSSLKTHGSDHTTGEGGVCYQKWAKIFDSLSKKTEGCDRWGKRNPSVNLVQPKDNPSVNCGEAFGHLMCLRLFPNKVDN